MLYVLPQCRKPIFKNFDIKKLHFVIKVLQYLFLFIQIMLFMVLNFYRFERKLLQKNHHVEPCIYMYTFPYQCIHQKILQKYTPTATISNTP